MTVKNQEKYHFKCSLKGLMICESMVFILLIGSSIALYRVQVYSNLFPVVFSLLFGLFIFYWFKSFSIRIDNGILEYASPFSRTQVIPIRQIKEAYVEAGVLEKTDIFHGFFRLVLRPEMASQQQSFYINMAVFNNSDMKKLMKVLPMKK